MQLVNYYTYICKRLYFCLLKPWFFFGFNLPVLTNTLLGKWWHLQNLYTISIPGDKRVFAFIPIFYSLGMHSKYHFSFVFVCVANIWISSNAISATIKRRLVNNCLRLSKKIFYLFKHELVAAWTNLILSAHGYHDNCNYQSFVRSLEDNAIGNFWSQTAVISWRVQNKPWPAQHNFDDTFCQLVYFETKVFYLIYYLQIYIAGRILLVVLLIKKIGNLFSLYFLLLNLIIQEQYIEKKKWSSGSSKISKSLRIKKTIKKIVSVNLRNYN